MLLSLVGSFGNNPKPLWKVQENDAFSTAKSYLRKYPSLVATLTDWTSLVLMNNNRIRIVLSFDSDFDRVKALPEFSGITRVSRDVDLV